MSESPRDNQQVEKSEESDITNIKRKNLENEKLWECPECTSDNTEDSKECTYCETPRGTEREIPTRSKMLKIANSRENVSKEVRNMDEMWECTECKVYNNQDSDSCICCEAPKSKDTLPSEGDTTHHDKNDRSPCISLKSELSNKDINSSSSDFISDNSNESIITNNDVETVTSNVTLKRKHSKQESDEDRTSDSPADTIFNFSNPINTKVKTNDKTAVFKFANPRNAKELKIDNDKTPISGYSDTENEPPSESAKVPLSSSTLIFKIDIPAEAKQYKFGVDKAYSTGNNNSSVAQSNEREDSTSEELQVLTDNVIESRNNSVETDSENKILIQPPVQLSSSSFPALAANDLNVSSIPQAHSLSDNSSESSLNSNTTQSPPTESPAPVYPTISPLFGDNNSVTKVDREEAMDCSLPDNNMGSTSVTLQPLENAELRRDPGFTSNLQSVQSCGPFTTFGIFSSQQNTFFPHVNNLDLPPPSSKTSYGSSAFVNNFNLQPPVNNSPFSNSQSIFNSNIRLSETSNTFPSVQSTFGSTNFTSNTSPFHQNKNTRANPLYFGFGTQNFSSPSFSPTSTHSTNTSGSLFQTAPVGRFNVPPFSNNKPFCFQPTSSVSFGNSTPFTGSVSSLQEPLFGNASGIRPSLFGTDGTSTLQKPLFGNTSGTRSSLFGTGGISIFSKTRSTPSFGFGTGSTSLSTSATLPVSFGFSQFGTGNGFEPHQSRLVSGNHFGTFETRNNSNYFQNRTPSFGTANSLFGTVVSGPFDTTSSTTNTSPLFSNNNVRAANLSQFGTSGNTVASLQNPSFGSGNTLSSPFGTSATAGPNSGLVPSTGNQSPFANSSLVPARNANNPNVYYTTRTNVSRVTTQNNGVASETVTQNTEVRKCLRAKRRLQR